MGIITCRLVDKSAHYFRHTSKNVKHSHSHIFLQLKEMALSVVLCDQQTKTKRYSICEKVQGQRSNLSHLRSRNLVLK